MLGSGYISPMHVKRTHKSKMSKLQPQQSYDLDDINDEQHIMCRMHIEMLERELADAKDQIKKLKDDIFTIWMNEVVGPQTRKRCQPSVESKQKWEFYHNLKRDVAVSLSADFGVAKDVLSWTCIKKETDKLWTKEKSDVQHINNHRPLMGGEFDQAQ